MATSSVCFRLTVTVLVLSFSPSGDAPATGFLEYWFSKRWIKTWESRLFLGARREVFCIRALCVGVSKSDENLWEPQVPRHPPDHASTQSNVSCGVLVGQAFVCTPHRRSLTESVGFTEHFKQCSGLEVALLVVSSRKTICE